MCLDPCWHVSRTPPAVKLPVIQNLRKCQQYAPSPPKPLLELTLFNTCLDADFYF